MTAIVTAKARRDLFILLAASRRFDLKWAVASRELALCKPKIRDGVMEPEYLSMDFGGYSLV